MSSHHTLRHQRRNLSGGELPPTPPTHSRTSSSSHSVNITTLSPLQTPAQSSEDVQSRVSPSTPPNQRSPPTPEVTPPRTTVPPKAPSPRPAFYDRIPSKCTTDSRTESFRTALESPEISDAEDSRSTLRPAAQSARTSQITVRHTNGDEKRSQRGSGHWSSAESNLVNGFPNLTPKSKREFNTFDGEWGSGSEVEQEWDENLMRNVTVRKRRPKEQVSSGCKQGALDESEISPSNTSRAVRAFPLKGRILTYEPAESSKRSFTVPETASAEASMSGDLRRLSGMSAKSTTSTVVEAILVERRPQQQKTLRHVRRVNALRDSLWQPSPIGSTTVLRENVARRKPAAEEREATRGSLASTSSTNSVASRKARRDVWKNGGIPVVVVPDRQSSNGSSSRDRSLRSASSKRSERRQSIGSAPVSHVSKDYDLTPYFDRPPRRGRTMSESDGSTPSDQRTIDYPPIVPRRTSSLSAPTSRNGSREASRNSSRAGSLTAESLRAHNDSMRTISTGDVTKQLSQVPSSSLAEPSVPRVTVQSVPSYDQFRPEVTQPNSREHRDKNLDSLLGSPLLPSQTTPFSQTSVETNGTAPEISEAMAVSIVPHQNRSILMVDHRPSESSDGERRSQGAERAERPTTTTIAGDETREVEAEPVTPLQAQPLYPLHNVDSPLRNPRAPPEPPVLQFIPATPSGLTPAEEKTKLLGNFYEATEEKPARGLTKVRRVLGGRRHSSYGSPAENDSRPGFLTRTFSLGKRSRRNALEDPELEYDDHVMPYDTSIDESRLHPDWRPTYSGLYGDESMDDYRMEGEEIETLRYPPIDNRPRPPKRTLSERMKRTFAIMPLQEPDDIYANDTEPQRRTIRRTPSGILRVVKHRGSEESLRDRKSRPPNSAETRRRPFFRRSSSLGKNSYESGESDTDSQRTVRRGRTWSLSQSLPGLSRRLSEKRREKRSKELRQIISGPRAVRDGVGEVIGHGSLHEALYHPGDSEVPIRR